MRRQVFAAAALALSLGSAHAENAIALAKLDYLDTSGETKEQGADHRRRMGDFAQSLARDLTAHGFRVGAVDCGAEPCESGVNPLTMQQAAKAAGVRYVFLGGVQKMSTLVQWGKFQVVDELTGRVVFDRLVTFRGDTDEAFTRAEAFMTKELLDPQTGVTAATPIRIALFDFELQDVSAGASVIPTSNEDRDDLAKATQATAALLEKSGRYVVTSMNGGEKAGALRDCDGCEAEIARRGGLDQTLVGVVTRVARTDYAVTFKLRDAASGKLLAVEQTDLRTGANYSWDRGAIWLISHKLLDRPAVR